MDVRSELKNAQIESLASDPTTLLKQGRVYWNTTDKKARIYNGTAWEDLGSGGGGSQITAALALEKIDADSNPKAVCLVQKPVLEIDTSKGYIDLSENGGSEISINVFSSGDNNTFLIYDLNTSEDAFDLCKKIEDALNNDSNTTITYTVTYSRTTRKITIADNAGSTNFVLKLSTGTNASNGLLQQIGYDNSADTASATSHEADDEIVDATAYDKQVFVAPTDADYIVKSRNYRGMVVTTTDKMSPALCLFNSEVDYSGLERGEKYYTKSAAITIESGVNDAIDFKEDAGSELNATINSGTYYYGTDQDTPYSEFCAAVKSALEAASPSKTYTVTYSRATLKFTITPSSGTLQFLFNTGTNAATSARDELGFDNADTSDASSLTSDNMVQYAGELSLTENATAEAVYAGVGLEDKFLCEFDPGEVEPIYEYPGDWLAAIKSEDMGVAKWQIMDMYINENGYGLLLYAIPTDGSSTAYYKTKYTKDGGATWHDSNMNISEGAYLHDYINASNYEWRARCAVDDNNIGLVIYHYYNGSEGAVYSTSSSDLDNWSTPVLVRNYGGGVYSFASDLAIRNDRAAIIIAHNNNTQMIIFKSERGTTAPYYNTWTLGNYYTGTDGYSENWNNYIFIQYFPEQTGDNQYRICFFGKQVSSGNMSLNYCNWAAASFSYTMIDTNYVYSATQDLLGKKNRILINTFNGVKDSYTYYTNEDYNSGTLTLSSAINITHTYNILAYNGYSSNAQEHYNWLKENRCLLLGTKAYMTYEVDIPVSYYLSQDIVVFKNILTGSYDAPYLIDGDFSDSETEMNIMYIPSIDKIMLIYKVGATTTNYLSEGKVYAKLADINSDGTLSWRTREQIDGGEALSGFQGYVKAVNTGDRVVVIWEKDGASTRYLIKNLFS